MHDVLLWFCSCVHAFVVCSVYSLDSGLLGLALAYALNMMGLFQYSVRQSAEVDSQVRLLAVQQKNCSDNELKTNAQGYFALT